MFITKPHFGSPGIELYWEVSLLPIVPESDLIFRGNEEQQEEGGRGVNE